MGLQRNTGESEGRWLCSQQNRTQSRGKKEHSDEGIMNRQQMSLQYRIMIQQSIWFRCILKERMGERKQDWWVKQERGDLAVGCVVGFQV